MNQDALWRIHGSCGVPPKLINLISELCSGAENAVRCDGSISNLFSVVTGVCQECVLAPTLFSACVDWILGRMPERSSCGTLFGNVRISDLFPVVTGVCQECVLAPTLISACMDWILGRISERSRCGASFGNVKISDLDFADDSHLCGEWISFWGPSRC